MRNIKSVATLETLSRAVNSKVEIMLFVLGFSMAFIVALQVFFRYVLNQSLFWSEELARYLLVWLTFLGASVAYRRKVHPGIDMLSARLSPWWQKLFAVIVHLVSLGLFGVMIVYGYQFAHFVRLQISPALYIPKWIIFSIIPISGALLALHALNFLFLNFQRDPNDG